MDGRAAHRSKRGRQSKACARCHRRKIRCDFSYPVCGACSAAGEECLGFDSIHGIDKPRSTVRFLEDEIARLEIELGHLRSRNAGIVDVANVEVDRLTTRLATAIVDPECRSRKQESLLPLTSPYFLSGSPVPYLNNVAWSNNENEPCMEHEPSPIFAASIPRSVVDTMLKHYCEIYSPLYPALEEQDLYSAYERLHNDDQPSSFDAFCVQITLAISSYTLMSRDEKRATGATRGLWATTKRYLGQIGLESSWERLQALLLLMHYGCLNPQDVNPVNCAAAATRLCIQLGLHQEMSVSEQSKVDAKTLNTRRRLFWHAYSVEIAVHTVLSRPFIWPKSAITAKHPEFDSESCPTPHVWRMRQIEAEIMQTMYYPSPDREDQTLDEPFDQWFTRIQERLNEWYQTTRESISLGERIEFHELMFQCMTLRLNRPSPRCPKPTRAMQKRAFQSSVALIREFSIINQMGKLFITWHAAFFLLESGVCLLASVLNALESTTGPSLHLLGQDVKILSRYIKTLPILSRKLASRWHDVAEHASAIAAMSRSVLKKLEQWSNGDGDWRTDLSSLKDSLIQSSVFSPFPSEQPSTADPHPQATTSEFPSAVHSNTPSTASDGQTVPVAAHGPGNIGANADSGWEDGQWTFDQTLLHFGQYEDMGYDFGRDFPGLDSEEILSALL